MPVKFPLITIGNLAYIELWYISNKQYRIKQTKMFFIGTWIVFVLDMYFERKRPWNRNGQWNKGMYLKNKNADIV